MHRALTLSIALLIGLPSAAQDREYEMTAEIGPLGAEPSPSTGGEYSLIAGLRPLPPAPDDRVFSDSFELPSTAMSRTP